MIGCTRAAVP